MLKKFFDFSISGILLTIGLGMYLTGLIIFGLSNVAVFCFFSSVLCFGMSFYLFSAGGYNSAFGKASRGEIVRMMLTMVMICLFIFVLWKL